MIPRGDFSLVIPKSGITLIKNICGIRADWAYTQRYKKVVKTYVALMMRQQTWNQSEDDFLQIPTRRLMLT